MTTLKVNSLNNILSTLLQNTESHKMNRKTATYHAHNMVTSGKRYIVNQMFGRTFSDEMQSDNMTEFEINCQVILARFATKLTRSMQKEFGEVLSFMKRLMEEKTVQHIPSSYSCLRRMYIDGEAAISRNIPIPDVITVEGHSYVSIIDCVADFLIRKDNIITNIQKWDDIVNDHIIDKQMHIFACNRTKEMISDAKERLEIASLENTFPLVPIFINFWSDDFDPNKSIKANRQSIWIKTATIFTMSEKGEKIKVTYPVSMALKKANHQCVEQKFREDIIKLSKGKYIVMYSRTHKTLVNVHGSIFCVMNDQPERRSNLDLGNGNSTVHGRFGLLLDCKQVQDKIQSCVKCTKGIIKEAKSSINLHSEWRKKKCKSCTCWMYNMDSKWLKYIPEKNYPNEYFGGTLDRGKLSPHWINKIDIETKVNELLQVKKDGHITMIQTKSYLKYLGLNSAAVEKIVLNLDKPYNVPPAWYDYNDLSIFVDVPMHLLMLGVTKSVMLKIGKWLRNYKLNSTFLTMSNDILRSIKSLNIEWCKILEYPRTDKTGGWVSENFSAMGRLGTWFYSNLENMTEAKKEVANVSEIMDLVESLCLLLKTVMCLKSSPKEVEHLEAIVRMFLIYYDVIDRHLNEGNASWVTQYNMLCLLNLPETMRKYGSLRNIWEGGHDGESYIKHVKRQLCAGLVNDWKVWVISNLLKEEIYQDWKIIEHNANNLRKEIKIYPTNNNAKESFDSGKPISVLLYNDKFYIFYRNKGSIIGNHIMLFDKIEQTRKQVHYSIAWKEKTINADTLTGFYVGVILLPIIEADGFTEFHRQKKYCYIRSDWV